MVHAPPDSQLKRDKFAVKLARGALLVVVLDATSRFLYGAGLGGLWPLTSLLAVVAIPAAIILLLGSLWGALRVRRSEMKCPVGGRIFLLVLLGVAGTCVVWPDQYHPKQFFALGARWRVERLSDEARLQAWAQALLELPPSQLPLKDRSQLDEEGRLDFDPKQLPEFVTALVDHPSQVGMREGEDGIRFIRLHLGGWVDGEWDLMLGGRELDGYAAQRGWQRWREGVYLQLR